MRVAACVISHERLPLTLLAISAFVERTPASFSLVVVDSGSSAAVSDFLHDAIYEDEGFAAGLGAQQEIRYIRSVENIYPGRACNAGWECALVALGGADVLVRLDNDIEVLDGWAATLEQALADFPEVGQFGLLDMRDEGGPRKLRTGPSGLRIDVGWHNVGGPCAVRPEVWDAGLRWDERTWLQYGRRRCGEDGAFSRGVRGLDWRIAHIYEPIAVHHGHDWGAYPDYYTRTAVERGYDPGALRDHFAACQERACA